MIELLETKRDDEGNTETSSSQPPQRLYWCFTYNNFEYNEIETIETILKHECDWYLFQEECGESNTIHLQGTLKLKERKRLTQMKHLIDHSIHWEATRSVKASILYCQKTDTAIGGRWWFGIEVPPQLKLIKPRGWQTDVCDIILNDPDERTIYWYWDEKGNSGKSSLAKFLVAKAGALMLTGKSNDMFHMISKFPQKRRLFIIDCPRSAQDFINYGAIEQIKNGLIFSGKYEGCQLIFNCPHVIVFANRPPCEEKMSLDRWQIVDISRLGGAPFPTGAL